MVQLTQRSAFERTMRIVVVSEDAHFLRPTSSTFSDPVRLLSNFFSCYFFVRSYFVIIWTFMRAVYKTYRPYADNLA